MVRGYVYGRRNLTYLENGMKYICQLVLLSLFTTVAIAIEHPAVEGPMDAVGAAQALIGRVVALPDIEGEMQMPAWQTDVLRKVLAAWKRPSQSDNSATWLMRVKTDSRGRLLNLSWITPTGDRTFNRSIVNAFKDAEPYPAPPNAKAALDGIEFADETSALRRAEEQKARNVATLEKIKRAGPLHAYLALVAHRYRNCAEIANNLLDSSLTSGAGMILVAECTKSAEPALADDVRLALLVAPASVSGQIKDLHAYSIASLRALNNFNQSIIEARQARAARSAGIDERTARMALDL